MSCVMYQPYAMSYSSSCDRTAADNLKKSFKFPHAPSPPESSHSNASSAYSSPGSTTGGLGPHNAGILGTLSLLPPQLHSPSAALAAASLAASSHNNGASGSGQRRPLTPCASNNAGSGGSSAPATITSASQQQQHHHHSHSHHAHPSHAHSHHHHHHHQHHSASSSASASSTSSLPAHQHHQLHRSGSGGGSSSATPTAAYPSLSHASLNLSSSSSAGAVPSAAASSSRDLSLHGPSSSSSSSSTSTSSHHAGGFGSSGGKSSSVSATVTSAAAGNGELSDDESPGRNTANNDAAAGVTGDESEGSSTRAQYLSANCILYVNYDGNAARVVEEHFNRALSAAYSGEKSSKSLPMSTRNFPASFWNSNYQPTKPSALTYGAADFYGTAMDYSAAIPGFAHHHAQADPWHYSLGTHHHHHHQSYHHRPSDIAYSPMTSTSRFNAAQYGSFLFPSTSAAAAAGRFPGIPTPGQCSVKGDAAAHHWAAAGGRYDGWSDLHLADYSAAAAHYSNMTAAAAGLDFETHYLQSS